MGRIIAVLSLVAVLAAAIIVPAVAAEQSEGTTNPLSALSSIVPDSVLSSLGIPTTEDSNTGGNPSSPDVGSSGVDTSLDPNSVSSSSSDPDDPAAVSQEFSERRITSGAASPSSSFSNSGDNVNACPTTQQVVNTGNVANQQGVSQYNTTTDDIDLSGSSITIDSSATATCDQTLNQAAAAGK